MDPRPDLRRGPPLARAASGLWLLNLDADHELAALAAGRPYQPREAVREQVRRWAARFAESVPGGATLVDGTGAGLGASARGGAAFSFCPTPSVHRALSALGLRAPEAPPFLLLAEVNERAFGYAIGEVSEGSRLEEQFAFSSISDVERLEKSNREAWLLKRGFGMSGRGQRRIRKSALSAADRRWIERSLASGRLYAEPLFSLSLEVGLHGWLGRNGELAVGAPTVQTCDRSGAWQEARRAREGELREEEVRRLVQALRRAAEALSAAGYVGPFGVDAYRYRDPEGDDEERFHPLSELNARYSMSYFFGMDGSTGEVSSQAGGER